MGAKFCFFTDPAVLAPQGADQAFGPAPPLAGEDRFRVTDLHSAPGGAPAFAACDGLLCAQRDNEGNLSLILKPIEQPPFDCPMLSYILYKGIDPASLLTGAGFVDVSKAAANPLVKLVQGAWTAPDAGNNGDPPSETLGLHLSPLSDSNAYPDLILGRYGDDQPLDHLFYLGDPRFQLPLVRRGWRLADFLPGSFGLEIVAERMNYAPAIRLARRRENFIAVPSLDPSQTYAANHAGYFMHWHAKNEVLNFIDPCAFWGSFHDRKLGVSSSSGSTVRKAGKAIYEDLLRGPHAGATPSDGFFFNRNKIYVDIRNGQDRPYDYYHAAAGKIFATLDPAPSIAGCEQPYNSQGWPVFTFDHLLAGGAALGSEATLRLAFPANASSHLCVYKPPENLAKANGATSREQLDLDLRGSATSPEIRIRFPLHGSGSPLTISRYVAVSVSFETRSTGSTSAAPAGLAARDGVPPQSARIAYHQAGTTALKTYSVPYILNLPYVSGFPIVYDACWIQTDSDTAMALVPRALLGGEVGARPPPHSIEVPGGDVFAAVNRLIHPLAVRRTGLGDYRIDRTALPGAPGISEEGRMPLVFVFSAQSMIDIEQAKGPGVAGLILAPVPTLQDGPRLTLELHGLRAVGGGMVPFSQPLNLANISSLVDEEL
jgi:hypothetical protein